jgi:hypothetical protein
MRTPDIAGLSAPQLAERDLLFLFEHFPQPGVDAVEAVRRAHEMPSTLESLLESDYVHRAILDRRVVWLDVSPRLFFNVVLRRALRSRRTPGERRAIHYLANVLTLFLRTDRVCRVQPGDERSYQYIADLVSEAASAGPERQFLVHCHIGNYALFLSGLQARWIEHRHRYRRRPVSPDYYRQAGRSYYASAAQNWRAVRFGLRDPLHQLAQRFDYFRDGLERIAAEHLAA